MAATRCPAGMAVTMRVDLFRSSMLISSELGQLMRIIVRRLCCDLVSSKFQILNEPCRFLSEWVLGAILFERVRKIEHGDLHALATPHYWDRRVWKIIGDIVADDQTEFTNFVAANYCLHLEQQVSRFRCLPVSTLDYMRLFKGFPEVVATLQDVTPVSRQKFEAGKSAHIQSVMEAGMLSVCTKGHFLRQNDLKSHGSKCENGVKLFTVDEGSAHTTFDIHILSSSFLSYYVYESLPEDHLASVEVDIWFDTMLEDLGSIRLSDRM